jgi:hypothetical protein
LQLPTASSQLLDVALVSMLYGTAGSLGQVPYLARWHIVPSARLHLGPGLRHALTVQEHAQTPLPAITATAAVRAGAVLSWLIVKTWLGSNNSQFTASNAVFCACYAKLKCILSSKQ